MAPLYIRVFKSAEETRRKTGKALRLGQSLMNALHGLNPGLYNKLTGTEADCFYDDRSTERFYEKVMSYTEEV